MPLRKARSRRPSPSRAAFVALSLFGGILALPSSSATGADSSAKSAKGRNFQTVTASVPSGKKFLLAGTSAQCIDIRLPCGATEVFVTQVKQNGKLDRAFGRSGTAGFFLASRELTMNGVGVDSQRRVLIAGSYFLESNGQLGSFVARLTKDGTLDTSFGDQGAITKPTHDFQVSRGSTNALAVDRADRVVVAGSRQPGAVEEPAVLRLLPSGEDDGGFGVSGIAAPVVPEAVAGGGYTAIALSGDDLTAGGWAAASPSTAAILATRLDSAGQPVAGFSGDGSSVVAAGSDQPTGVDTTATLPASDGSLVLASTQAGGQIHPCESSLITRLSSDGSIDTAFGTGGQTQVGRSACLGISDAGRDSRGRIVAAGASGPTKGLMLIARLGSGGKLQKNFANDGDFRSLRLADKTSGARSVLAGPHSSLILGGFQSKKHCGALKDKPCQRGIVAKLKRSGRPKLNFGGLSKGWRRVGP